MKIQLTHHGKNYSADLSQAINLSIPFENENGVKCFMAPDVVFSPVKMGSFVGEVKQGSAVNFFNAQINPHGNGTHTECLGHITKEQESVNEQLKTFHFLAELISLKPEMQDQEFIISEKLIRNAFLNSNKVNALIIRTLPNSDTKLVKDYTSTNPPYFSEKAMQYLLEKGIEHLLVDLPSVDKEDDGGKLMAHKTFWQTETSSPRKKATITELIYVPNEIEDGLYLLNLQIAPFVLDASPSKPTIYKLSTNE